MCALRNTVGFELAVQFVLDDSLHVSVVAAETADFVIVQEVTVDAAAVQVVVQVT